MSEVIFKNQFGEYKVGDKIYAVTSGYAHSINIMKGVLTGITESGCIQLVGEHESRTWVSSDTGEEYDWTRHARVAKHFGEWNDRDKYFLTESGEKFIVLFGQYTKNHTLQLNRIMPRPE